MAEPASVESPPRRRRWPLWIGLGLLLLLMVGGGAAAWVAWRIDDNARLAAQTAKKQAISAAVGIESASLERLHQVHGIISAALAMEGNRGDSELTAMQLALQWLMNRDGAEANQRMRRQREIAREIETLAQQAADFERLGDLPRAEALWSKALSLDPGNSALDVARERIRALLRNAREAEIARTAQAARAEADLNVQAAELHLAQPNADLEQIVVLLHKAETLYAQAAQLPGTHEQIRRLDVIRQRAERAQAEAKARSDAERLLADARVQAGSDTVNWNAVLSLANQALALVPLADAELRLRIIRERDTWVTASARADSQRGRDVQWALCDDALKRAAAALTANNIDEAMTAASQALANARDSEDRLARAIELRDRIRVLLEERSRVGERARRSALAEQALIWAANHLQAFTQAQQFSEESASNVRQLERQRAAGAAIDIERISRLRAAWSATSARAQAAWEAADACLRDISDLLVDQPTHATLSAARALRADLHIYRLRAARAAGNDADARTWAAMVERFDDTRRYRSELAGLGTLVITGATVGVRVTAMEVGAHGRMTVAAVVKARAWNTSEPGMLAAGTWLIVAPEVPRGLCVRIVAGATTALRLPGRAPEVGSIDLAWVPPADAATPGFWLGTHELRRAQISATVAGDVQRESNDDGTPLHSLTRAQAQAICQRLSAESGMRVRLPTLSELAWAAQGGDPQRVFPWGSRFDPAFAVNAWSATCAQPSGRSVADVGPFGHCDLAGNLREWCADEPGAPMPLGAPRATVAHGSFQDAEATRFAVGAGELIDAESAVPYVGMRIVVEAAP